MLHIQCGKNNKTGLENCYKNYSHKDMFNSHQKVWKVVFSYYKDNESNEKRK